MVAPITTECHAEITVRICLLHLLQAVCCGENARLIHNNHSHLCKTGMRSTALKIQIAIISSVRAVLATTRNHLKYRRFPQTYLLLLRAKDTALFQSFSSPPLLSPMTDPEEKISSRPLRGTQ